MQQAAKAVRINAVKPQQQSPDIRLLPDGTLVPDGAESLMGEGEWIDLVGKTIPAELPGWRFIRTLVVAQLRYLIEQAGEAVMPKDAPKLHALLLPEEYTAAQLLSAPPVKGAEYWSAGVLRTVLQEVVHTVARRMGAHPGMPLAEWARSLCPAWRDVGKISFHLAENKADTSGKHPFAFMATFIGTAADGTVRHWPLSTALQMYTGNQAALQQLIEPVRRVAKEGGLMEKMLAGNRLFHPCAWTAAEAYRFLQEVDAYREAGIVVRVFNLWKGASPTPQVRVQLAAGAGQLSARSLLEFSVEITLGGVTLSERELRQLMRSEGSMVQLRGQWVMADADRIGSLLKCWKEARELERGEGVSFVQGLRLLAGVSADGRGMAEGEVEYVAADSLQRSLAQLTAQDAPLPPLPQGLDAILRPYQREGVGYIWRTAQMGMGVCLADDMGLGKTLQMLSVLALWKEQGVLGAACGAPPALLVLPATLLGNWQAEAKHFTPWLRVGVLHPAAMTAEEKALAEDDMPAFLNRWDVVLTTYGMAARMPQLQDYEFAAVVADEAQAIKTAGSARSRAVRHLKAPRRVALTGTPVENHLGDLWSLFDFVNPGLLGTQKGFQGFVKQMGEDYAPLRRLTRPFILRRLKSDKRVIADLPDKTELTDYCPLSKKQAALYARCVESLATELENSDGIKRRGLVFAYLARFKQICNHPAQYRGTGDYAPEQSGKFAKLAEIVETVAARQEKMLVFTQFREMTEPLQEFLTSCFGRAGLVLHGGTPVKHRAELVRQFQQPEGPPFFVISLKAGGTGLNLTAASHVVHFDRWWNPAVENQASDRAYRIGQKRNVLIHRFVCPGTLEERIDAMLEEKSALAEELFSEGAEKLLSEMNNKELLDFVALARNTWED